ncbi:MAG TPA: efflux transporter outer membrane subunit [Ideonella sp.]|uniref:efflux transporter outer membrane subunit n=1 Tax=Ideonella sp. TaxID=1929293 RepID=UPI002E2F8278|nr:efflux transporter outer membrane subunit [Ideonella sp.]HEX5686492.1 efflux transporter outer membrane subunit [Ideonella sp.]
MKWIAPVAAASQAALLAGCAGTPPAPESLKTAAPAQWHAPLPHQGQSADLTRWWQQFDDPLVAELVTAAETASPTLAAAQSRLAQARAARAAAGAALWPTLDASASLTRGRAEIGTPLANTALVGAQAAWEIDLFGAGRAGRQAAAARLSGAEADWHDARVLVAAEAALSYVALRACEAQWVQTQTDAASRIETARLTSLSAKAGFQPPASDALARASAAQARSQLAAQAAQCDLELKTLVALTAQDEPTLRSRLEAAKAKLPQPAQLNVGTVPAELLAQRPDVAAASHAVEAASADVDQAQAQRLPRVSLAGSVSRARIDFAGGSTEGNLWSLGPLSVSLPIFDAGVRAANVDAARARYDETVANYRGKLRTAVREVESALVQLDSSAARSEDARVAVDGFEASFRAAEARYRGGLASLFELEDARRSAALARSQLIDLQRERVTAWITLYRALGGGWQPADTAPMAAR